MNEFVLKQNSKSMQNIYEDHSDSHDFYDGKSEIKVENVSVDDIKCEEKKSVDNFNNDFPKSHAGMMEIKLEDVGDDGTRYEEQLLLANLNNNSHDSHYENMKIKLEDVSVDEIKYEGHFSEDNSQNDLQNSLDGKREIKLEVANIDDIKYEEHFSVDNFHNDSDNFHDEKNKIELTSTNLVGPKYEEHFSADNFHNGFHNSHNRKNELEPRNKYYYSNKDFPLKKNQDVYKNDEAEKHNIFTVQGILGDARNFYSDLETRSSDSFDGPKGAKEPVVLASHSHSAAFVRSETRNDTNCTAVKQEFKDVKRSPIKAEVDIKMRVKLEPLVQSKPVKKPSELQLTRHKTLLMKDILKKKAQLMRELQVEINIELQQEKKIYLSNIRTSKRARSRPRWLLDFNLNS